MSETTYKLRNLSGEFSGSCQVAEIHRFARRATTNIVTLDCSDVQWIDAHFAASFGAVAWRLRADQKKILQFSNLRADVQDILECTGLFGRQGIRRRPTVIPFRRFELSEGRSFAGYTQDHFANKGIPAMSSEVSEKFFEGIDELFQNAVMHSKTAHGIFAAGQLFPRKSKLNFSVVDLGIGFKEVIRLNLGIDLEPAAAIDWAMTGSNTTRKLDIPGGLGLKILKEFVTLNRGKLSVVSRRGFWCMQGGRIARRPLACPFPGTLVTLEVNTSDRSTYRMREDIDPSAVF